MQYGLDPSIVHVRRAKCTYGIGVIRPFIQVRWLAKDDTVPVPIEMPEMCDVLRESSYNCVNAPKIILK